MLIQQQIENSLCFYKFKIEILTYTSMYPVIQRCSQRFVKHVKSTEAAPIVIKDYTSGYTMDVIASTAFGLEMDVQETTDHKFIYHAKKFFGFPTDDRIITRIKSALNLLIVFVLPQFIRKFLGLFFDMTFSGKETSTYLENLIATILDQTEAKPEKRNNFISMCKDKLVDLDKVEETSIKTTNGKKWTTRGLTRKEVMANAAAFISAGIETTASTLQFFFYLMAIYPDIQDKLYTLIAEVADENGECSYEDMKKLEYLDWCIDESMRMFPIASRFGDML
ncbi:CYP3A4 [Bugula neritina]|uniref:CYP3A4 n=1 Tax=Bugula neritina TaxID=10212 RepID=A0A7J7JVL3_BUGNE|nr:CYP3A4 [Bugula neritina]